MMVKLGFVLHTPWTPPSNEHSIIQRRMARQMELILWLGIIESLARKLELNLVGVLEKPFRIDDLKYILDGL
jgi:hypothetical protein